MGRVKEEGGWQGEGRDRGRRKEREEERGIEGKAQPVKCVPYRCKHPNSILSA